jgi:hypothetical protein
MLVIYRFLNEKFYRVKAKNAKNRTNLVWLKHNLVRFSEFSKPDYRELTKLYN